MPRQGFKIRHYARFGKVGAGSLRVRPLVAEGGVVHVLMDVNGYFE